ncbi:MAG TPA: hypothetical protein VFV87_07345 [Pirellulaceae bacterium]|nr:hypothetical protein [Pirellulaceae bacterium]
MTCRLTWLSLSVAVCAALAFVGCDKTIPPNVSPAESEHHEGDGHEHGEMEHGEEGHSHPTEGPHHGHLIELGEEEYHAELAHDDATKTVTVYLLDKEAKAPVAIPDPEISLNLVVDGQPMQFKLKAAPQEGDPAGQASMFSITDETVLEAHDAPKTTGNLNVTISGKEYSAKIEHAAHGEHEHKK